MGDPKVAIVSSNTKLWPSMTWMIWGYPHDKNGHLRIYHRAFPLPIPKPVPLESFTAFSIRSARPHVRSAVHGLRDFRKMTRWKKNQETGGSIGLGVWNHLKWCNYLNLWGPKQLKLMRTHDWFRLRPQNPGPNFSFDILAIIISSPHLGLSKIEEEF